MTYTSGKTDPLVLQSLLFAQMSQQNALNARNVGGVPVTTTAASMYSVGQPLPGLVQPLPGLAQPLPGLAQPYAVVTPTVVEDEVAMRKRLLEEKRKQLEEQRSVLMARQISREKRDREIERERISESVKTVDVVKVVSEGMGNTPTPLSQTTATVTAAENNPLADAERKKILQQRVQERLAAARAQWQAQHTHKPGVDLPEAQRIDEPKDKKKAKNEEPVLDTSRIVTTQGKEALAKMEIDRARLEQEKAERAARELALKKKKEELFAEQKRAEEIRAQALTQKYIREIQHCDESIAHIESQAQELNRMLSQKRIELNGFVKAHSGSITTQKENQQRQDLQNRIDALKSKRVEFANQERRIARQANSNPNAPQQSADKVQLARIKQLLARADAEITSLGIQLNAIDRELLIKSEGDRKNEITHARLEKAVLDLEKQLFSLDTQKKDYNLKRNEMNLALDRVDDDTKNKLDRITHRRELEQVEAEKKRQLEEKNLLKQKEQIKLENERRKMRLNSLHQKREQMMAVQKAHEIADAQAHMARKDNFKHEQEESAAERIAEIRFIEENRKAVLAEEAELERLRVLQERMLAEESVRAREAAKRRAREEAEAAVLRVAREERERLLREQALMEEAKRKEQQRKEEEALRRKKEQEALFLAAATNPLMNPLLVNTINPLNQVGFGMSALSAEVNKTPLPQVIIEPRNNTKESEILDKIGKEKRNFIPDENTPPIAHTYTHQVVDNGQTVKNEKPFSYFGSSKPAVTLNSVNSDDDSDLPPSFPPPLPPSQNISQPQSNTTYSPSKPQSNFSYSSSQPQLRSMYSSSQPSSGNTSFTESKPYSQPSSPQQNQYSSKDDRNINSSAELPASAFSKAQSNNSSFNESSFGGYSPKQNEYDSYSKQSTSNNSPETRSYSSNYDNYSSKNGTHSSSINAPPSYASPIVPNYPPPDTPIYPDIDTPYSPIVPVRSPPNISSYPSSSDEPSYSRSDIPSYSSNSSPPSIPPYSPPESSYSLQEDSYTPQEDEQNDDTSYPDMGAPPPPPPPPPPSLNLSTPSIPKGSLSGISAEALTSISLKKSTPVETKPVVEKKNEAMSALEAAIVSRRDVIKDDTDDDDGYNEFVDEDDFVYQP